MSRLSRKEFKELLVEWNKNFSSQRKESKDVSEGIMKNAAFGLGAVISLLG